MPQNCAVSTCKLTASSKNKGIVSFFTFPRDKILRRLWINKCKREDKFNLKTARICSSHFSSDDFERDLQGELLNIPLKRKLKSRAVPSLNLGNKQKEITKSTIKRNERVSRKAAQEYIKSILTLNEKKESISNCSTDDSDTEVENAKSINTDDIYIIQVEDTESTIDNLRSTHRDLVQETEDTVNNLIIVNRDLVQETGGTVDNLRSINRGLLKKIKSLEEALEKKDVEISKYKHEITKLSLANDATRKIQVHKNN